MIRLLFFVVCVLPSTLKAQEKLHGNTLSLELGKNGLQYQLSFDHRFAKTAFGYRIAAGSNFGRYLRSYAVAAGGYYLVGKRRLALELGADMNYLNIEEISDDQRGFVFISPDYTAKGFAANLILGFRVTGKHTLFRMGYAPMTFRQRMIQGAYLSFGFRW